MPTTPDSTTDSTHSDPLRLLSVLGLRAGGLVCQLLVVVMEVSLLGTPVTQLTVPLVIMALGALASIGLWRVGRRRQLSDTVLTAAIIADIVVLTVTLGATGGPHNPFTFFYVIHVATAVVVVDRPRAWAVAIAASLSFLALFLVPVDHHVLHDPTRMNLHMRGMWLAFVVTAAFVVLFVGQLRATLDARTRDHTRLRALTERGDRLAALATLAGGAAHELATPLSTIAVVADELRHRLKDSNAEIVADIELIAAEVRRCRTVLTQLAADAGTPAGEAVADVDVDVVVADAIQQLGDARGGHVVVDLHVTRTVLIAPRAFTQAIRGLMKNAFEAGASVVTIGAVDVGDTVVLNVVDDGPGFDVGIAARIGEPFVTTKSPGAGMGLGLFLTRTLVERFGGRLEVGTTAVPSATTSAAPRGAHVTITLPATAKARRTSGAHL